MARPKRENKPVSDSDGVDVEQHGDGDDSTGEHINGVPVTTFESAGTGPAEPARRRGRPAGSGTGPRSKEKGSLDLKQLTDLISGVHNLAAFATRTESLNLSDDEAEKLARALKNLQQYYPHVDLPGVVLAWCGLGVACTQVYGSRIAAWGITRAKKPDAVKLPPREPAIIDRLGYARP